MQLVKRSCFILGIIAAVFIGSASLALAKEDTVKSLKVLQTPDKCAYNIGQEYSSTGLQLQATLSSSKKEIVDNAQVTTYVAGNQMTPGRTFQQEGWKSVDLVYKGVKLSGALGVTVFDPNKQYYIEYNTDGGNAIAKHKIDSTTQKFELPIPTKKGYVFTGWYEPNGYKRTHYIQGIGPNLSLKAHWAVEIRFNANGGSGKMENGVASLSYKLPKATFKKSGYKCVGWSKKKQVTRETDFYRIGYETDYFNAKPGAVTLYAQWVKPKAYRISYIPVKGVTVSSKAPKRYTAGKGTNLPTPKLSKNLMDAGKSFAGWKVTVGSKTYATYCFQMPVYVSGNVRLTPIITNFEG